jgi:hypothetical protein
MIDGQPLKVLQIKPSDLAASTFACTFEEAASRLADLDRMFVEPDGSFVWAAESQQSRWQMEGNLYDRGDRLQFVDLKGICPAAIFDQILTALDWPQQQVVVQLSRHGLVVEEQQFRRWASR